MISDKYILLVEDDIDINNAIESILCEEGYNVSCTFNGQEALRFLQSAPVKPALIFLDMMMPVMNGYEFRQAQLKIPELAKIPTIVLSANGKQEEIRNLGVRDSLNKPLDLETLIDTVKLNISNTPSGTLPRNL